MIASPAALASPCVRICSLDAAGSLCVGCGRTIEEIANWSALSDDARSTIIGELADRLRLRAPEAI
jgi:uncharacterized protein